MWWIPAAAAAISAAGSMMSNKENKELSREQMSWQENLANTAHQREVADLKAAGLNPMISGMKGAGAPVPAGSVAKVENVAGQSTSSALQAAQTQIAYEQVEQNKAQTDLIRAQSKKLIAETLESGVYSAKALADIELARGQGAKVKEEILGARYDSQDKQMRYRASMGNEEVDKTGWAADVRRRKAEAAEAEYRVSEAKASSKFYESDVGAASPGLRFLMDMLKGLVSTGARR